MRATKPNGGVFTSPWSQASGFVLSPVFDGLLRERASVHDPIWLALVRTRQIARGDYAAAAECYRRILDRGPTNSGALLMLARSLEACIWSWITIEKGGAYA